MICKCCGSSLYGPPELDCMLPSLHGPAVVDTVNHPAHYTQHPSGVECIQITEHMNFCRGNAVKYIWRAGEKGNEVEDLKKARWYLDREIERIEKQQKDATYDAQSHI